ncbi:MAG: GDP-L-fucose synthase [Proteobacteria bacterium]|nr:GDP-L-fucose synthase [Pseudomonadota bacterium]
MSTEDAGFKLARRRVWVAGHNGMVGSALVRRLAREDCEIVTVDRAAVDLRRTAEVEAWMGETRPDVVVMAAARVGGILANDSYPADFIYDNLMIAANVIDAAHRFDVAKLLFLGSSCIYPKHAPQPMAESALLTGPLEPTNQWYAVAKIAGIKLCQAYRRQHGRDFIAAMPTNLYGPGDNFDLAACHVVPALIAKTHAARESGATTLEVWGTGKPRREFLYVDDAADALVHLLKVYSGDDHVNIGCGEDIAIAELAGLICEVVGYDGALRFDAGKPDGTPRKLLDVSRLAGLGWTARTPLREGLALAYDWFLAHAGEGARRAIGATG